MTDKEEKKPKEDEVVEVPQSVLAGIQEQMAKLERDLENEKAARAGLEELVQKGAAADGSEDTGLRKKKNYEPKFRTVRVRKFPMGGDENKMGFIAGWTNRGAFQEVDRTGVSPQVVDYLEVVFLDNEKTKDGKIKAEKIKLLDLLNKGIQVHAKILETKNEPHTVPTGEEIDVTTWDPQHGLIATGEKIDGFVTYTDIQYRVQIPGVEGDRWIDSEFVN